ncbi:MAG: hypothetical protein ARM1_0478 [Candidatus Micrarchaeota archaeon]|nr:MAG: hypothetical protein ARM1_0478 [Candidatus Micrarchaeota archaeon]
MVDQETVIFTLFAAVPIIVIMALSGAYGKYVNILVIIIALIGLALLLALAFADFLIVPYFMNLFGLKVQPAKDFTTNRQQNAIIKQSNGIYYTIGYLTANLYSYTFKQELSEEDTYQKIINSPLIWENIISSVKVPFRYNIVSFAENVQKVREALEAQRGLKESQLTKLMQASKTEFSSAVADLQRAINIIQRKIDRISAGEKPVRTIMYIEVFGAGVNEKAALDDLEYNIDQVRSAFASFDIEINRVAGRELFVLFEFGFFLPSSYSDIEQLFSKEE